MKIEYYSLNGWNRWGDLDRKFASIKGIQDYILKGYQFVPCLYISGEKFTGMTETEPDVIVTPVYKSYKNGVNKGLPVLDKNGKPIIIDEIKTPSFKIVADYSKYKVDRSEFDKSSKDYLGYYELSYEVLPSTITDIEITYSARVFIEFITAEKEFTPEIKKPGVPYQESKMIIKEVRHSKKYPLKTCQGKYGISDNLDNWHKTVDCFVYSIISWDKEVLEIED